MCEAGCTKWGIPDSLVPGTVGYHPKPRIFGNRLVGVSSVGHRSVCLGYLARGTALWASHRYPRLLNQLAMISRNNGTM
jgi:hypothetical protein